MRAGGKASEGQMQPSRRTLRVTLALAGSQLVPAPVSNRRKEKGWGRAAVPAAAPPSPPGRVSAAIYGVVRSAEDALL